MTHLESGDSQPSKNPSWAETAWHATLNAVEHPLIGLKQLQGQAPPADTTAGSESAKTAGTIVGSSALYLGATMLGRLALGRFAPLAAPLVGSAFGFLEPTAGGGLTRVGDALLGAISNTVAFETGKGIRNDFLPHAKVELLPGEVTTDWVKSGGRYRQFAVRMPSGWDPVKPTPLVVAADSSLIAPELIAKKGYIHGMDDVNGVGAAADRYNAAIMYPIPKSRWGGLFRTWNTLDGVVNMFGTRFHDDGRYIRMAMDRTMTRANIDRNQVFGFGYDHGGTMLQYQVGTSAPGTFNKISVWSSTVSPRVPMPPEGTAIQVGHSLGDKVLGWQGARGGVAAIPEKFGYTNISDSQPFTQAQRFGAANGITEEPAWQRVNPNYQMRQWRKGDQVVAEEMLFDDDFHGVRGRTFGGSNESFTSTLSATGTRPASLSAVDEAFRWYGLKPVKGETGSASSS